MRRYIYIWLSLFVAGTGQAAESVDQGQVLLEMVKSRDDTIRTIVRSETGGESQADREALRRIVSTAFDYTELSKLSLGRYWAERTEAEKEEFVGLNKKLIEKNYGDPALYKKAEKIDYTGVEMDGEDAVVSTQVFYKSEESTIDYKLHLVEDAWLIYDMVIDDLSIGRSNRSQFRKEILKSSYEGLIRKLKDKLEDDH